MTRIFLSCHGATARARVEGQITHGMTGIPVTAVFDEEWENLSKTLKVRCGEVSRIVSMDTSAPVYLPYECLIAGQRLECGVDGWDLEGTLRLPSDWASCGIVKPSVAQCDGPEGALPAPGLVEEVLLRLKAAEQTADQAAEDAQDAMGQNAEKLNLVRGKNLINPHARNRIEDAYVDRECGGIGAAEGFRSVAFPVEGGRRIAFNSVFRDAHVVASSEMVDLTKYPVGTYIPGYLGGFANIEGDSFVWETPPGSRCLIVSFQVAEAERIQCEYGEGSTGYVPYAEGIHASSLIGGILLVGTGCQYKTISAACAAAADGDTIYVMPGVYHESVICYDKVLHIRGCSRDSVILTNDSGDYDAPPLYMAKGSVENITVAETSTAQKEGAKAAAYCVHVDRDEEEGHSLMFRNVRFSSVIAPCVGIGMRTNFQLSFVDCDFSCDEEYPVYLHESQQSGSANQYAEFINCTMNRNSFGSAIVLQETPRGENTTATVRFQRCVARSQGGGVIAMQQYLTAEDIAQGREYTLDGSGYLGSKVWTLDERSAMNGDALMNAIPASDATLAKAGAAADAKTTGDRLNQINGEIEGILAAIEELRALVGGGQEGTAILDSAILDMATLA